MSGHSKWSTIKRKKEKNDSARAKIFTKIGREIFVAVKSGGADINSNFKLRELVAKAKANNVPGTNIERVIKKAAGDKTGQNYEHILYEGYGPEGVAVMADVLTDNRNRTASNIRYYFDRFGGNLGSFGCVSFLFEKKGVIYIDASSVEEDSLVSDCIEIGVDDVEFSSDIARVLSNVSDFCKVRDGLQNLGYSFISAEIEEIPKNLVSVKSADTREKIYSLIERLEDDDDVQKVWTNLADE